MPACIVLRNKQTNENIKNKKTIEIVIAWSMFGVRGLYDVPKRSAYQKTLDGSWRAFHGVQLKSELSAMPGEASAR